jgi:putative hydrolase of the HAD superfamily
MRPDARAVIFDLDDTLYPLRDFVESGFRAVSQHVGTEYGIDEQRALQLLHRASHGEQRGRELQALATRFGLPTAIVGDLVDLIRLHIPVLRLPALSFATLLDMRPTWRIGIVTNGFPQLQARKVEALGLGSLVDTVIYAAEHGSGRGKPDREPFLAALDRLGVEPDRAVFVGDDERCDVYGASHAGLHTIHFVPAGAPTPRCEAEAIVRSLVEVPGVAERLVSKERVLDVA